MRKDCRRCGHPWENEGAPSDVCHACWVDMGQRSFEDDETLGFWTEDDGRSFWLDSEEAVELRRQLSYWEHG